MSRRAQAAIIASMDRYNINCVARHRQAEVDRRNVLVAASPSDDDLVRTLVAATDQFIAARRDQQTIIAGYHWFTDWGRDTMIALPGLTLLTGRADVARSILLGFARHIDRGMLPNRFPDVGEQPEYNTVDATLWFFQAVWALWQYTNDYEFIRANLYGVLAEIIDWHVRGTRYGIHMDEDGLLASGQEGVQLTWMDAKVGDWVVTPRRGKPVEIQALWYNALRVIEHLAHVFDDEAGHARYGALAARAHRSFNQVFWNEAAECLYDVVDRDSRDGSIRPNQIFAVSLPYTLLPSDNARRVVEVTQRELLTPYGLRTLAPSDPRYRGRCEGDQWSRDTAYHQGSVWPWLMGPFMTAYVKVHDRSKESRAQAARWLAGFREHLEDGSLGQISELFDGNAPHHPRGCIAQAWSVAELLRAVIEDLIGFTPATPQVTAGQQANLTQRSAEKGEST